MPTAHPGPPLHRIPDTDGVDLQVHPHRTPYGITVDEHALLLVFLRRYALWCAKSNHVDRLRDMLNVLVEARSAAHCIETR